MENNGERRAGNSIYTLVGGDWLRQSRISVEGISIVLLGGGTAPFRQYLFDKLCGMGALEVLSIESVPCPYDVPVLLQRHNNLRFLVFPRETSLGERINAAFCEGMGSHFLVLTGSVAIAPNTLSSLLFKAIVKRHQLCTVPVFIDYSGLKLPTAVGPMPRKEVFDVLLSEPGENETSTLLPWDYSGIYTRENHFSLGGFDPCIDEPWWQLLEYGMRACLWGEKMSIHPELTVQYLEEPVPMDTSVSPGYRRYYLKTLAVRYRKNTAILPKRHWLAYMQSFGDSFRAARADWKDIAWWVRNNSSRFRTDAAGLAELWQWN